jgi:hypothetical protein
MHKAVLTAISLLACQAAIAADYDFWRFRDLRGISR